MDHFSALNEMLVGLFRNVMDIEQKEVLTSEFDNITNNDIHVIEAIGIEEPKNMSAIAKELSVTVGTLTIAMNSLVKKGYVIRRRGDTDRRVVYISLSELGKRAFEHHKKFHKDMIDGIMQQLDEEELQTLVKALTKLDYWFQALEDKQI